ncbi:MAG: hypothetical protein J2O48_13930, partial [Solirubrobacterales bacterium]|nr:hypothetical protein [Solirubrobacterales bacterium]
PRPAGSDAERRTATWLTDKIGRKAELETFWVRPSWTLVQCWHVALAVAGSLVATTQAQIGSGIVLVALALTLADWVFIRSPGRFLTPERATQNVVSPPINDARVKLVITAGYDTSRLDPRHARWLPGWLFWLAALMVWVLVMGLVRIESAHSSTLIAVLQLLPTVGLVGAAAALLLARQRSDESDAVATALALTRALDTAPPTNLGVELLLTGGSATYGLGLHNYLKKRRKQLDRTNIVVLGIQSGDATFYLNDDGPLLPLAFFGPLRNLAAEDAGLPARLGRGCSPALRGRMKRLPSLTIGGPPSETVTAGLLLVDAIDSYIASLRQE